MRSSSHQPARPRGTSSTLSGTVPTHRPTLAVPVWLALKYDAEWRWLRDRHHSPRYPAMQLFRQHGPGWTPCLRGDRGSIARERKCHDPGRQTVTAVVGSGFAGVLLIRCFGCPMARRAAKTLHWHRPVSDVLATGTIRRTWKATDGRYRVEEHKHQGVRAVYLAIDALCLFISQHRKRKEAIARCELARKKNR
jgi:hypothetical protein